MSIELLSENPSTSPRISFSHDLRLSEAVVPLDQQRHHFRSDSAGVPSHLSSSSFDFNFSNNLKIFGHEPSSADELFSDGKIVPTTQIKKHASRNQPLKQEGHSEDSEKQGLKSEEKQQSGNNSKSFWKFKRSRSLNLSSCGSGYGRSLCPLPLLSRSNSTGSPLNSNNSKESHHNHLHFQKPSCSPNKQGFPLKPFQASSSLPSSSGYQKPPLRKSNNGFHGNFNHSNGSFRVNPVLHVPSGNLFGLGSMFLSGKDKSKIRK
ncbi:hypothetical protein ACJRO7_024398 [Eucalyptus globulus]|uniref:Uncharacterized protein n=1 Tax=Eucalyptus globulus TaxID=34317 RepID=A0ABD3K5D2_EUCGL